MAPSPFDLRDERTKVEAPQSDDSRDAERRAGRATERHRYEFTSGI
ncbi:MAG TPA: hypothetical protein PKA58_32715 [Polyangium sp.]|nr:hypothetical protein [Polyangium sp.]